MSASSSSFHNEVVEIVPHRFEGVFIAKGKEEDALCTKNLVPGEALYDEELISVQNEDGIEVEYRVWNPVRSKLASAILSGLNNIWTKPGSRVLCLGDVCGTTVSHLSDLVGPDGLVYAVGLSETVVNMLEKRSNVLPIMENTACTWKYRMIMGMVDVMYAHAAYCHEETIIAMNAEHYLKSGGHFLISTQGEYIASTSHGETMFNSLGRDRKREFKPLQLVPLKPLERDLTYVVGGVFRMPGVFFRQIETSDPLDRCTVAVASQAPYFRKPEDLSSEKFRAEMATIREYLERKGPNRAPIKRAAPRQTAAPKKKATPDHTQESLAFGTLIPRGVPTYLLFEFALGYALFLARGINDIERNFESAEKYINNFAEVFKLEAFHPFESVADALCQMKDLSESILSEQLKNFLMSNLPKPIVGETSFSLAVTDAILTCKIVRGTKIPCHSGHFHYNVIRGLRMNIDKFIDLKPGDLERAQLALARGYKGKGYRIN